jgi:hypothetical protein
MRDDDFVKVSAVATDAKTYGPEAVLAIINEFDFDVLADFEPLEGHIYTRTRAISARVNQNFDGFPSEELKSAYKTFIGKPVFVNHHNEDPDKARGCVVASRYVEAGDDKYIEVIQEVNAQRFPKLAKELAEGGLDAVSMGTQAGRTICSYCGYEAQNAFDVCDHIIAFKGQYLTRTAENGMPEDVLVYEECRDLGFFELSYVFDPADETALVSSVIVASKRQAGRGSVEWVDQSWMLNPIVTDDNGKKHSWDCSGNALSAMEHNALDSGFEDAEEWVKSMQADGIGVTVDSMLCTWLSDGTVDCECGAYDSYYDASRKVGFGETEAPEPVNTLREDDEQEEDDYHRYVEPPTFLDDPDMDALSETERDETEPDISEFLPFEDGYGEKGEGESEFKDKAEAGDSFPGEDDPDPKKKSSWRLSDDEFGKTARYRGTIDAEVLDDYGAFSARVAHKDGTEFFDSFGSFDEAMRAASRAVCYELEIR